MIVILLPDETDYGTAPIVLIVARAEPPVSLSIRTIGS
jgi:hypothetical protein